MEEENIFNEIEQTKKSFGMKCKKFSGSLTVEVLKSHLEENGFTTSNRDVFIRGVDSELDLLIIQKDAKAQYNLIYKPNDVVAVLEIKATGAFGKNATAQIKATFDKIKSKYPSVFSCYVTLQERKSYKYRITSKGLGYPAYTIFFHKGQREKFQLINTGEWSKFLNGLKKLYVN
jgi:hypothetical protein